MGGDKKYLKRKLLVPILVIVFVSMVSASDFQISSISHEESFEENDILEVEANITNDNATGIQKVKLAKNGSKVYTKNIQIKSNESKNLTLSYTIESGDAQQDAEFKVETQNDSQSFIVDIATLERTFNEGWNYFSLPVATQSQPEIPTVLEEDKVESVWRFEEGEWESYAPAAQENPFNSIKGGEGYIVNADSSFTIRPNVENTMDVESVEGSSPVSEEMQQGWNLIGHYWEEKQNPGTNYALDSLPSDAAGSTYEQSKNGELSLIQLNRDFRPGQAYWQFVNTDTEYGKSKSDPTTDNTCCDPGTAVERVPDMNVDLEGEWEGENILSKNESINFTLEPAYFDEHPYRPGREVLSKQEFQNKTITEVYITDEKTLSADEIDGVNYQQVCNKESELNDGKISCEIDSSNLSIGSYQTFWNVSRKDGRDWRFEIADRTGEFGVVGKSKRLNSSFNQSNYTVTLNNIGVEEQRYQSVIVGNITLENTLSENEEYEAEVILFDKERNHVLEEHVEIPVESGSRTKKKVEFYRREGARYALVKVQNDRGSTYQLYNISEVMLGDIPRLSSKLNPVYIEKGDEIDTPLVDEQNIISVNLNYGGFSSDEISEEEYNQNGRVSFYLIGQNEIYREEKIKLGFSRSEYNDINNEIDVTDSNLSREVCENKHPSGGFVGCAIDRNLLKSGETYKVFWRIGLANSSREKWGDTEFTAVDTLTESEIGENREVKINVSSIRIGEPSNGWKEFTMESFLHNKNMTYSENNATSSDFLILGEDKEAVQSDNGDARIPGVSDIRRGYNESQDAWGEKLVDSAEPHYLLATANYGVFHNKPVFAFTINRSGLQ